jgi:carboxymethylenebutenolidase
VPLLATEGGSSASSVNYGGIPEDADTFLHDACPIVGSYGARDRSLRNAGEKLERALDLNGIPHDVKVYPEAGHAFINEHAPAEIPMPVVVLMKLSRAGYHEPPAVDARRRIVAFFSEHLGEPSL